MDLTKFIFKTIALFLRITPKLKIYSIQFLIILSVACFVEFIYTLIIVLFMSELLGDKEIIAKFETTLIKYFDVAIHVDAKFIAVNLGVLALASGVFRIININFGSKISQIIGTETSAILLRKFTEKDIGEIKEFNASEFSNVLVTKVSILVNNFFNPIFILFQNILLVIFIIIPLISSNGGIILFASLFFALSYVVVNQIIRNKMNLISKLVSTSSDVIMTKLNMILNDIKSIKIDNKIDEVTKSFDQLQNKFRGAQKINYRLSESPKFIIEALSFLFISIMFYLSISSDSKELLSLQIGSLAIAGQRLLPLFQQLFRTLNSIKYSKESVSDIVKTISSQSSSFIDNNFEACEKIEEIEIRSLGAQLKDGYNIFSNINILVKSSDKLGISGPSGSGKSTLMNVLLGLTEQYVGDILINKKNLKELNRKSYFSRIAHVPQEIYIFKGTLHENLWIASKTNQQKELAKSLIVLFKLNHLEDKLLSENGENISGGEKQRIGLIRALSKNPDVLFLDEGTSALDNESESIVLEYLKKWKGILIMISHKDYNFRICNKKINLKVQ